MEPKKTLVLHIAVPGFNGDDLDEFAGMDNESEPTNEDRLEVIAEWMRTDVGVTLVSVPGDKCMNDDFMVKAFDGEIVGAHLMEQP